MWRDPGTYIDIVTEFVFNGCNFMLGYMVAQGQIINASKGAWLVAGLTGLVGAANHLRALRKTAAVLLIAVVLSGCASPLGTAPVHDMTAKQIQEYAKIKDTSVTCIIVNSPYGKGMALFLSLDKGVIPAGTITVDDNCVAKII